MGHRLPAVSEAKPSEPLLDVVPILLSPGLRNRSDKLLPVVQEFARQGRAALAIEHRHTSGATPPEFVNALDLYPRVEVNKAASLYEVITSRRLEQVDVVGYCEGAVNGAILASLFPNLIRNFVVLNPAGMNDSDDKFSRIAKIFIKKSIQDVKFAVPLLVSRQDPDLATKKLAASWDRIAGLPTLRVLSRMAISPELVRLEQQGVKVAVLQSRKDSLYPYDMVRSQVPNGLSAHATLADPKLGHAALLASPEFTVRAIVQLIESLNDSTHGS